MLVRLRGPPGCRSNVAAQRVGAANSSRRINAATPALRQIPRQSSKRRCHVSQTRSSTRDAASSSDRPNMGAASAPRNAAASEWGAAAASPCRRRCSCSASAVSKTSTSPSSTLCTPRSRSARAISLPWAPVRTSTAMSPPPSGWPSTNACPSAPALSSQAISAAVPSAARRCMSCSPGAAPPSSSPSKRRSKAARSCSPIRRPLWVSRADCTAS